MPTRQECIDAAGRVLNEIRRQADEWDALHQTSSPAQGSGEDNTSAAGRGTPSRSAAENQRRTA